MTENQTTPPRMRLQRLRWLALGSIAVGGIADLMMDRPADWLSFHVVFETLMIVGALIMATTLWLGWSRTEQSLEATRRQLAEGLGAAIDEQFKAWGLTAAEREVALLLLKGYSHKHVASVTGRSERTARQHGAAVYQKAGLSGRAELAAFFLQNLLQ